MAGLSPEAEGNLAGAFQPGRPLPLRENPSCMVALGLANSVRRRPCSLFSRPDRGDPAEADPVHLPANPLAAENQLGSMHSVMSAGAQALPNSGRWFSQASEYDATSHSGRADGEWPRKA